MPRLIPLPIRIASYTKRQGSCLLYTGVIDKYGYGQIGIAGKTYKIHRIVWEMLKGKIPDGLVLDHLCKVRNCINISHLDVVTLGENTLRGNSFSGINARKEFCDYGHEFNNENTHYTISTKSQKLHRRCKPCHKLANKKQHYLKTGKSGFLSDGIRTIYVPKKK